MTGEATPKEPEQLSRGQRAWAWLRRPKLWDDVFTRTLANVLSVLVLGLLAIAFGIVRVDPNFWGVLVTATASIGFLGMCFYSWRWTPGVDRGDPTVPVVVFGTMFFVTIIAIVFFGDLLGLSD